MKKEAPLVSVCLITYNHGQYIDQCIENILSQKVNFEYEIIIAEDFSTDNTRDIIIGYKEKFPDKFRLILQPTNVGPSRNFNNLIMAARGKYLAYIEGDDYWCDDNKLQSQVNCMNADPAIAICFHNAAILNFNGIVTGNVYGDKREERINIKDLLLGDYTKSCTCMVLTANLTKLSDAEFAAVIHDDNTFFMYLLEDGSDAVYINKIMAVYRIHDGGIWSRKTSYERYMMNEPIEKKTLARYIQSDSREWVIERVSQFYLEYAMIFAAEKRFKYFVNSYSSFLKHYLKSEKIKVKNFIKPPVKLIASLLS